MAQPNQDSRPARRTRLVRGAALGLAILLSACSSDGGGVEGPQGPSTTNEFAVDASNVIDGSTWQLNRPIQVTFNKDVDFTTVSQTTIQIVDGQGVPAVGAFSRVNARTIRFQPRCPTNATNTNGGLLQGRNYRLTIPSESTPGIGGGLTVQSTSGERLVNGLALNFNTPTSTDPLVLFVDQEPGAPAVRVRGLGIEPLDSPAGSYVEFPGLDSDGDGVPDREFLLFDPLAQQGNIGQEVPLNLYSDPTQQFAFVLRFNQAVFAAPSNINSQRLGIEYFNATSSQWETVPSTVQLLSNCTSIGAEVRLAPEGVVPQGSEIRAVVREGFADLTNDAVPAALTNFARVESTVANPGAMDPGDGADEIREPFDVGGAAAGSREDTEIASANPRATWAEPSAPGTLTASFDFGGTGGPAGEFDWVIPAGVDLIISTDADVIQGGPDGTPIYQQPIIGGLINVRNMEVETNASVTFVGSNTVTILATGSVEIRGDVTVNGGDSRGVGTLNTTNQPEPGAPGNAGGGDGGVGSFQTNQSTARGGTGQGAFGVPGLGGQGGETGYSSGGTCAKEDRRGAGGGGGGFGRDIFYLAGTVMARCQMLVGMDAEDGIVGSFDGTGAVSQTLPAQGGEKGPDPFTDPNEDNDFFGVITLSDGRQIRGELPSLWAGAGGGAGGDASRTNNFPQTPFQPTGDEKGSGAGGGAGGIEILAIGDISILGQGQLSADGGTGNGGENSIFFDRIGGGSGGGSGGHVVLSSAGSIRILAEASGNTVGAFYDDSTTSLSHIKRPLRALGGQNGAGRESRCGANENGEMTWARDSIPEENFAGNLDVPPNSSMNENGDLNWARICSTNGTSGNFATCQTPPNRGETFGAGGDGAPGIIQLHVSDPTTQLVFGLQGGGTYGVDADPTFSMAPPPLGWSAPADPVDLLVPFFSARSESFTQWIPLGLARLNPNGTTDQVEFLFDGTDPMTGVVDRNGTTAQELPALIDYTALTLGAGAGPSVDAPAAVFTFPDASFAGGSVVDDFYRANAALLREFAVRVRDNGNPATEAEYIVQSASYDAMAGEFTVVVADDDPNALLADTLSGFTVPEVELVPFFFRLESATVADAYPVGTEVAILFDAARVNQATGEPSTNPAEIFSGGDTAAFTPDITDLNNDVWDFVRVKFEFLIDINDLGAPRPGLDFVKIPFRF